MCRPLVACSHTVLTMLRDSEPACCPRTLESEAWAQRTGHRTGLRLTPNRHEACTGHFRARLWTKYNMARLFLSDPECWMAHLSLNFTTGLDPEGIRVRNAQGLDAVDFFFPGVAACTLPAELDCHSCVAVAAQAHACVRLTARDPLCLFHYSFAQMRFLPSATQRAVLVQGTMCGPRSSPRSLTLVTIRRP
jgi:hypothetical protein